MRSRRDNRSRRGFLRKQGAIGERKGGTAFGGILTGGFGGGRENEKRGAEGTRGFDRTIPIRSLPDRRRTGSGQSKEVKISDRRSTTGGGQRFFWAFLGR